MAMNIRNPRYADDRYAVQRRIGFRWLRFMPDLEREYRDGYIQLNATRLRLAHGVGIAATFGFILMDWLFGLQLLPAGAIMMLVTVTVPALAVPILATYYRNPGLTIQRFVFFSGLLLGLSLTAVVELSRAANTWFPYEALLLVVMYVYLISSLLYFQAAVVGLSVLVMFVLGETLWQTSVRPSLLYESYYLFIANIIGLIGLYALRYEARQAFLLQNELRQEAVLDSLTGLLNRREFRRHFEAAWAQAQREQASIGVLLVDLDDFKAINDAHGHMVGDVALRRIGEVLRKGALRPLDSVARYGGDEFIAMWYDVDAAWFSQLARELPERIGNLRADGSDLPVPLTISGGAVLAYPRLGMLAKDAIKLADKKLYEMKRERRGTIAYAEMPGAETPQAAEKVA